MSASTGLASCCLCVNSSMVGLCLQYKYKSENLLQAERAQSHAGSYLHKGMHFLFGRTVASRGLGDTSQSPQF